MAQYKVLETSWIGDRLRSAGEIIEYNGDVGPNLELVEADKPKAKKPAAPASAAASDDDQSVI